MSKQVEWLKKHIVRVMIGVVVILIIACALFIRGKVRAFKSRKAETTIAKEPTINTDRTSQEYEVDNSNAAAILGTQTATVAEEPTAPISAEVATPAPTSTTPAEEKPKATSKPKPVAKATKVEKVDSISSGGGALAEMERREKAAVEKVRAEESEKVRKEREARVAAEDKAAKLEEEMRKPKFNFTIVQERNDFGSIDFPDKSKKTQDKELLYLAKIYGTQRVKSGDPVTLRNTEAIQYGKNKMPIGSIIYGIAQQSGNRMMINLSNVMTRDGKFPITGLSVCDYDMIKGIYLKEYEEVAQDNASESVIEEVGSAVPNQLIGTIATTTSKQIQKNINKQQKIVITLEDNYEVYVAVPTK